MHAQQCWPAIPFPFSSSLIKNKSNAERPKYFDVCKVHPHKEVEPDMKRRPSAQCGIRRVGAGRERAPEKETDRRRAVDGISLLLLPPSIRFRHPIWPLYYALPNGFFLLLLLLLLILAGYSASGSGAFPHLMILFSLRFLHSIPRRRKAVLI